MPRVPFSPPGFVFLVRIRGNQIERLWIHFESGLEQDSWRQALEDAQKGGAQSKALALENGKGIECAGYMEILLGTVIQAHYQHVYFIPCLLGPMSRPYVYVAARCARPGRGAGSNSRLTRSCDTSSSNSTPASMLARLI